MTRFSLLSLLLLPLCAGAAQPWVLAFPDIAYDSTHAYFSGPQWTAFYAVKIGNLVTVPRDSLTVRHLLPDPVQPVGVAHTAEYGFICDGSTLVCRGFDGRDTLRTLLPPTSDAIACLTGAGTRNPNPADLQERMSPAFGTDSVVWFGLTLRDPESGAETAGLGWFDPHTNYFGRVYSPSLAGYQPQWVGARDDSVYVLFSRQPKGKPAESRLVAFDPLSSYLAEIDLDREGVPGDVILSVVQWNDTLLIATDRAVAIWKPHRRPEAWHTVAWASNRTTRLYLKTFPDGKAVEYMPLRSNTPTDVKAMIGDWLQVVAPLGIEGYVDPAEWEKHSVLWSLRNWSCGDSLCFVRLRVPMKGVMVETDFTNTALTYLDRDRNGVKVGFKAAWARLETMAPVMVPLPEATGPR
jgi:hypothetical protein